MHSGHYKTYACHSDIWYFVSDTDVRNCSMSELQTLRGGDTAYILFYEMVSCEDDDGQFVGFHTPEELPTYGQLPQHIKDFLRMDYAPIINTHSTRLMEMQRKIKLIGDFFDGLEKYKEEAVAAKDRWLTKIQSFDLEWQMVRQPHGEKMDTEQEEMDGTEKNFFFLKKCISFYFERIACHDSFDDSEDSTDKRFTSMCNTATQISIPNIALQRYFHKHYYKKLYADMASDSIDAYSDKELREAEESVLHHLNYCTQFKINDHQILIVLRSLSSCPDVILTPFILSSILSIAQINRDPDNNLSSLMILPFLRNVIAHKKDKKESLKLSAWFRYTLQTKQVDIEQIFTFLIDQNKEGKDVITPGLVNLAFILLKAKSSAKLNRLGTEFLQKFVKKRFTATQIIIPIIAL